VILIQLSCGGAFIPFAAGRLAATYRAMKYPQKPSFNNSGGLLPLAAPCVIIGPASYWNEIDF